MGRFRAMRSPLVARSLASATASPALSVAVTAMATLARTAKAVDNFMMMNEGPGKDEGRIDTYFDISVAYKSISSDSGLCVFQSSQAVKLLTYMRPPSMSNLSLSCRTLYVKVEAGVVTQNYGVQIKASRARFRSITALEALFFAIHSLELRSD